MLLTILLVLAFLMGCVCVLRSMTGPAIICWAASLGWLQLDGSKLAFLHNPISLVVFTLLALGELVADNGRPVGGKARLGCVMRGGVGGLASLDASWRDWRRGWSLCGISSSPVANGQARAARSSDRIARGRGSQSGWAGLWSLGAFFGDWLFFRDSCDGAAVFSASYSSAVTHPQFRDGD